jgi:hypothetical protein
VISGFVAGQEAFAFSEPPTKGEKQLMSILFLAGFVVIYTGIIYVRKSSQIKLKISQL